uniref:Secreted protein n=1 Tax=Micrurus corallinus TaxID=54390 RepID=A0A2D4F9R8_MICCO
MQSFLLQLFFRLFHSVHYPRQSPPSACYTLWGGPEGVTKAGVFFLGNAALHGWDFERRSPVMLNVFSVETLFPQTLFSFTAFSNKFVQINLLESQWEKSSLGTRREKAASSLHSSSLCSTI